MDHEAKKYIKKHIRRVSVADIAKHLGIHEDEICAYLKKIWKKEKFDKFVNNKDTKIQKNTLSARQIYLKYFNFFLLLGVVIFLVYFNSLNNEFVSDDIAGIANNPLIGDIGEVFRDLFYFTNKLLRFLIFHIFGLSPFFFRLPNLLLHIGSSIVLFFITTKLVNARVAVFASAFFAVHPILTEAIVWIGGGDYILYSFLFFLSFAFYLYSGNHKSRYYASVVAYLLMLSTSEKTFHLFLVFILYELIFGKIKESYKKLFPFLGLSIIWGVHYISALFWRVESVSQSQGLGASGGFDNPLVQIPVAISSYLKLTLWPDKLTLYHSELSFNYFEYSVSLFIFFIFVGLIIYLYIKNKKLVFWPLFFLISLLPFLTPFRISWLVAERYMYLGSVGLFVLVGYLFYVLEVLFSKYQKYIFALFILIIIGLSVRTIVRNNDWQNQDSLWIAAARTSPSSSQNHNNLGDMYGRHGDLDKAIKSFKRAIELNPNYADAYHNLANTYVQVGEIEFAIENYNKALEFNPNLWQSHAQLASIYFNDEDYNNTILHMEKAFELTGGQIDIALSLAQVYTLNGDFEKAEDLYNKVLEVDPLNKFAGEGLENVKTLKKGVDPSVGLKQ